MPGLSIDRRLLWGDLFHRRSFRIGEQFELVLPLYRLLEFMTCRRRRDDCSYKTQKHWKVSHQVQIVGWETRDAKIVGSGGMNDLRGGKDGTGGISCSALA